MTIETFDWWLLGAAIVVLIAVLAVRVAGRLGLPGLLVYLAIGVVIGESGLGIEFDDARLAQLIGYTALIIILAEGGITTRWSEVKGSLWLGMTLAIVGTAVSTSVVAAVSHYLLGFDWRLAFLLGAVVSATDAAAVFSVLRKVPLPPRLAGALESESGLNDAPTVLLVTLLSTTAHDPHAWYEYGAIVGWELLGGTVVGFLVGWLGASLIRRVALPASGLYPLAVLGLAFLAYAGSAALHASGFAAVYVASLVLGNAKLPHRRSILSFVEGLTWLAQVGLFVMLGLLAWPGRIGLETVAYALVIGVALTFLARPLGVALSALPFRMPLRQGAFLSWAGLRGAIPIVLATIPLAAARPVPRADLLFDIVFVLVIVLTLAQGPTLPWVARRLGVVEGDRVADLEVEAGPLDLLDADLLEIKILATSKLAGVEVGELRLPPGASVSLLVRNGQPMVPTASTPLRAGDDVLVVTPRRVRDATERRLRAVSREGRLARWRYRRPVPPPEPPS